MIHLPQVVNGIFVPGMIIETKSGPLFIPGQVVRTDEGLKFVPGQIVEMESGALFVPGEVIDSPHEARCQTYKTFFFVTEVVSK